MQEGFFARRQRGYGLGGIFASLFRGAVPLLKQGAKAVGKQMLSTGSQVLGDVIQGENIKESLKKRNTQGAKNMGRKVMRKAKDVLSNGGNKRKRTDQEPLIQALTKKGRTSKRKKQHNDAYGN